MSRPPKRAKKSRRKVGRAHQESCKYLSFYAVCERPTIAGDPDVILSIHVDPEHAELMAGADEFITEIVAAVKSRKRLT